MERLVFENSFKTKPRKSIKIFVFYFPGLIMMIGIIMYISAFKSQVGHKLRYLTIHHTPRMSYSYGYSFALYLSGFIAAELAGTSAVYLFLRWYQKDWVTQVNERAKADCRAWDREYAFSDDFRERDSTLLERRMGKRDTYPPTCSSTATPRERRRFIYDGESGELPHCSLHENRRLNLSASSLKDLSTSTLYGFPAAPRPTACDNYLFEEVPQSANTLSGLRSVSIFQSEASITTGRFLDTSAIEPPPSRDEELVTFGVGARDLNQPGPSSVQAKNRRDRGVNNDPNKRTTPV